MKKDQIRPVEVTCPACGGRGRVRLARPEERICCKFCDHVFRATDVPPEIDFTKSDLQRTVVEAAKVARTGPAPPPESVKEYETLSEALEAWREKLGSVPRWALGLGGVAMTVVVLYALWITTPLLFTSVPDDLAGRAKFTAEGVARNQSARISAISAFGTGGQAQAWADLRLPKEWISSITRETPLRIQVKVVFEDREKGRACTVASVFPGLASEADGQEGQHKSEPAKGPPTKSPVAKPLAPSGAKGPETAEKLQFYEVHWAMYWVLSPRGWMLDGKETYEAGKLR